MDDIATLPLVGGHPALDFVNTAERGVPVAGAANGDALRTAQDALAWARRTGLVAADETGDALPGSLPALRELREAIFLLTRAVTAQLDWADDGVVAALDRVSRANAAAARRSRLRRPDAGPGPLTVRVGEPGPHLVADRVVTAAVELLTGDLLARIKACPIDAGGCGWVFVDRTKNGSRTWCRMADCGTQVKSRRLTERRRADRRAESGGSTR